MRRTDIHRKRIAMLAGGLVMSVAAATVAQAQQAREWSLNTGLEHSDNIRRVEDGSESDTIAQAGIAVNFNSTRPRLSTDIGADLKYWNYLDHTYNDELIGGFNGGLTYSLIPQRFTWMAHDNFGQVAADPRSTVTADNRRNVNFFTTGPDFTLPLGRVNSLVMSGRYSRVNYEGQSSTLNGTLNEGTGTDNVKYLGSVGLVHRLSEQTSISLNGSGERTDYADNTIAENYDTRSATVGFDATGVRTNLSTSFGYTEIRFAGESHSGLLARLSLGRKVGTRSTLTMEVGTQYADTADTFAQGQVFRGVSANTSDATASNDPFKSDYLNMSWVLVGARNTMTLGLFTRKETHQREADLDRKVQTLELDLSRRMGPQVTLTATGRYIRDRFQGAGFATPLPTGEISLDSWSAGAGLEWLVGRSLGFQFRFDHQDGSGTGPSRTYTENRAYAGLVYSSGPRR